MTKIIKVESCGKCPYKVEKGCWNIEVGLSELTEIDSRCPLEDDETGKLKAQIKIMKDALENLKRRGMLDTSSWASNVLKQVEEIV